MVANALQLTFSGSYKTDCGRWGPRLTSTSCPHSQATKITSLPLIFCTVQYFCRSNQCSQYSPAQPPDRDSTQKHLVMRGVTFHAEHYGCMLHPDTNSNYKVFLRSISATAPFPALIASAASFPWPEGWIFSFKRLFSVCSAAHFSHEWCDIQNTGETVYLTPSWVKGYDCDSSAWCHLLK